MIYRVDRCPEWSEAPQDRRGATPPRNTPAQHHRPPHAGLRLVEGLAVRQPGQGGHNGSHRKDPRPSSKSTL